MIIGHKKQWQFLKKTAELGKIPHAFLFLGPSQLGKRTFALELIKLINCEKKDFSIRPCLDCQNCQSFKKGIHPDFFFIEPIEKDIQISQIRKLRSFLSLKSQIAQYKAVIIDRAHLLNKQSQNSVLKILEEPKGKTILILVTEHPEMLFPTIISRVEKIKFFPVPKPEIEKYLKSQKASKKDLEIISHLSWGKPGRAIDFLRDPSKKEFQEKTIKEISKLVKANLNFKFQYAKKMAGQPQNLKEILEIWLRYFRGVLLLKIKETTYHGDSNVKSLPSYSVSKLKEILKLIQSTSFLISTTNVNPKLALEILMLEL
ncbi:MAG TPA: DNA polymerase III subunit delta' [Candidatus Parcubacteria bacterium]|jgi:DNA polymerase-3 subunit delta'|nr:DNA polymerase III subunit delta' [Candidatus Parcubacteria bacterium]